MRLLKANEFNKEANIHATNCFAFALGLTENGGRYELPRKDVDGCNVKIAEAFKYRAAYNNIMLREVSSLEETEGKVAFILFGWFAFANFHVVRKNSDGTFEHKPDWKEPATEVTWEEIRKEYPEDYHVFILA